MKQIPATGSATGRRAEPRRPRVGLAVAGAVAAALLLPGCRKKEVVASFPDSYAGVGLELKVEGDAPVVVRALVGGSAEQAGILAGDRVTAIDGVPTKGLTLGDVVVKLRGAPNSQVTLTLDRQGQKLIVALRRTKMVKKQTDYAASP